MQATYIPPTGSSFSRKLSFFLAAPLTAIVGITLLLAFTVASYQSRHNGHVFTGVYAWGVDLSQMSPEEVEGAVGGLFPYAQSEAITFVDPLTQQEWQLPPSELGLFIDGEATAAAAMGVGRSGGPLTQIRQMFDAWYYGLAVTPVVVFDQGKLDKALNTLAAEVYQPAVNAAIVMDAQPVDYLPGQPGRRLDVAELRSRLVSPMLDFKQAKLEMLFQEVAPSVFDEGDRAAQIEQLVEGGPITFYLQQPLNDLDVDRVTLTEAEMSAWLRVDYVTDADGTVHHQVFLDENGVRHWLDQFGDQIYQEPVNARYYFNDDTRELVLVAPHINGRALDVDATMAGFLGQAGKPNRSVPLVLEEIVPVVNSEATAAELGITELITETTTWFYGSTDARKHNIARAAANFYGIVVAPGEEFSFNRYLGTVTEDDGYEEGLIIVGGRTIRGIGGGVCQVSTTIFQTAFWSGFPITERWEHGYMLGYYNDGEGPGMDATVYSPIVDLRFINNTPHHLLIENYYNEENEALTFKFYSTSMGRTVVKEGPVFENVVPAPLSPDEDVWEFDDKLASGEVVQIDWATDGADVTVQRIVYNASGQEMISEYVVSNYIPYPNVYHYGPDVEAGDYSLVPEE